MQGVGSSMDMIMHIIMPQQIGVAAFEGMAAIR